MKEIKAEAKTIQDAVEKGLIEMGLRRDQVEVVVIHEGSKGILGIGAKKACVMLREKKWTGGAQDNEERQPRHHAHGRRHEHSRRDGRRREQRYDPNRQHHAPRPEPIRERQAAEMKQHVYQEETIPADIISIKSPEDPVEHAKAALTQILSLMGMSANVTDAKLDTQENVIYLKFDSSESAAFTHDNGRGLQSLQFLVNSIVNRGRKDRYALRIDTADYWTNKEQELIKRVEQAVKNVQETARPYRLDPMSAPLRKFVHGLIKSKYPDVETASEGEGKWRKVVIRPLVKKEETANQ